MGTLGWVLVQAVEAIPHKVDVAEAVTMGSIPNNNNKWVMAKGPISELRANPVVLLTRLHHTHPDSRLPPRIRTRLTKRAEVPL